MRKDVSFEEVINGVWNKTYAHDADPGVQVYLSEPPEGFDAYQNGDEAAELVFTKSERLGFYEWSDKNDVGIPFTFIRCWDEFFPTSHAMKQEDIHKLYNIFAYANELYKMVAASEQPEAKALIEKILTDTEIPY